MGNRCKVVGCKKVSINGNPDFCKNHICRCDIGCCKVHDKDRKWIKDFELRDGTKIVDVLEKNCAGDKE